MFPVYEEKKENLHLHSRIARHESPHLHNSVEFIYLTEAVSYTHLTLPTN